MLYGLYTSGNGMRMQMRRQDVISNNLANSSANGFKSSYFNVQDMGSANTRVGRLSPDERNEKIDNMGGGPWVHSTRVNFEQGNLLYTENEFDLALEGSGFFKVKNPETNDIFYTRNGQFILNDNNEVVMAGNGFQVLDPGNNPIAINELDGSLMEAVKVVDFSDHSFLQPQGSGLFKLKEDTQGQLPLELPSEAVVSKGFLEESNTSPINEMVQMIEAHRAYEANARALKQQDENLGNLMGITRI